MASEAAAARPRPGATLIAAAIAVATIATGAVTSLAGAGGPAAASTAAQPAGATYRVVVTAEAGLLLVDATFSPGLSDHLTLDRAARAFVTDVTVADGDAWRPAPAHDGAWSAPGCRARGCRVRYRFALADAARAIDHLDTAAVRAGVTVAPTTTWLLRPDDADAAARFQLTVQMPPGWTFVSGLPRAPAGHEGPLASQPLAPYAAFGVLTQQHIDIGGGAVDVALAPDVAAGAVVPWLRDAAQAITAFYGRFPVPRLQVVVLPTRANLQGKEMGGGGASILLAPDDDPARSGNDWVATHEMVHVATPELSHRHLWMTEGLATYVEPIARARAGQLAAATIWADMVRGMPKGLAHETDRGMDGTGDWGRLYWGGALYWLLADVAIRTASDNRESLDTALRAVLAAGGNTHVSWPVERFLDAGDRALSRQVLRPLYQKMGLRPMPVDLPDLWRKLGVAPAPDGGVTFNARAPLAHVRTAITGTRGGASELNRTGRRRPGV